MMKYKIALVEYLNTFPFSEGMRLSQLEDQFEVLRVPPAVCAELYASGEVDIALCPVGALHEMPPYDLTSRFCIGADGTVGTVMVLSHVPLEEIKTVQLDPHSRTSNLLVQILAERHWRMPWNFVAESHEEDKPARLMIGDKVFTQKSQYRYQYDLAQAWKELTGLPMIFAVWINQPAVPEAVMARLDQAFQKGMDSIVARQDGLAEWQRTYLLHNISYPLDSDKRMALDMFLQWAEACSVDPVTR